MKKKENFLKTGLGGMHVLWEAKPRMVMLYGLYAVLHGCSWALEVVFTQKFFDAVQTLSEGSSSLPMCLLCLLGMILAAAFVQMMNGVHNCYGNILCQAFIGHNNQRLFEMIGAMSALDFEDPKRLDRIEKAKNGGETLCWVCLTLLDIMFFYGTYFVVSGIYLFTLQPILCVSLLAVFIPGVFSRIIQIKTFRDLEENAAPVRRKCEYYEKCTADIRETRLLGATGLFRKRYEQSLKRLNKLILKAQLRKNAISLAMDGITALGYGVVLYLLFKSVMDRDITLGAFAAVLASLTKLFNFMLEVVNYRFSWAAENSATAENFLRFLDEHEEKTAGVPRPVSADLELKNVSFRYPGAKHDSLSAIDLKIKSGETVAIVGENGSGKSTLCRVLLGLYPPTGGTVSVGGRPGAEISSENDSAVFQNYCRYKLTLRENLCIGRLGEDAEDGELKALCREAGVDLENPVLTEGLGTRMGREFDGADLSGGQWQRVAIARGLKRAGSFIVLDEPTSAIDPIEESELYREFAGLCKGRTAVIVTHRLGSARIADRIIVLKSGSVAEEGTHEALMQRDGEYARLYMSQSQWYA